MMNESFHLLTWHMDDEKSMGYTLRTLGAALWAYWHVTSYKEGILKIVLSGGDADTNAAVAGAILGAKFGINPIPEEWKDGLFYASMLYNKVQEFYAMYR
nr:ADP-ribosylglycohydrolase family protein [uncultured Prevotella sp.]